jgi:hypothetical protein
LYVLYVCVCVLYVCVCCMYVCVCCMCKGDTPIEGGRRLNRLAASEAHSA